MAVTEWGSLADRAYRQLRLAVIDCRLAPSTRLTESSVAARLGVGKMPAREALRQLVGEGLVQVLPRHGYVIAPITLGAVRELFELRLVVEPAAVERAVGKIDPAQYARLKVLSRVGYRVGEPASRLRYVRANTEFHVGIAQHSGNRRLAELVERILRESERVINFILPAHPHSAPTLREHRRLLDAMIAGDASLARRITVSHIRATRKMVVDALLANPRFADTAVRA